MELTELPNIGIVVSKRLKQAGIADAETLRAVGAKEAFLRLRTSGDPGCLSLLCGLEGAVRGVRWHQLPPDVKAGLKSFLSAL